MLNDDLINHINNSCYGKNGEYCSYYKSQLLDKEGKKLLKDFIHPFSLNEVRYIGFKKIKGTNYYILKITYYNAEFTIRYDGNSIMGGLFRNVKTHRLYSVKDLNL